MASDFIAYMARDWKTKEGTDKTYWTAIGRAKVGKESITVYLDAFPVNGKVVLLKPKPKDKVVPVKLDVFRK